MKGKGVLRDHSQPGTFSGKKTLKNRVKGNIGNVVLIDVDSDEFNNVIIIDVPESSQQKSQGSRVREGDKKFPFQGVISIDDDESNGVNLPGTGVEVSNDLDSDATSSKRSSPASEILRNVVDTEGVECQVIREKKSSFNLPKCKQTNSEKAPCRNRYGLYPESESGSSDSDCSDCEIMEDSFGKLHELWEKASQRRKYDVRNGQSGLDDEASASGQHSDTQQTAAVENMTKQHTEARVCSDSSNTNLGKENAPTFFATRDGYEGGASQNAGMGTSFVESEQKGEQERFSWSRSGSTEKTQFSSWSSDFQFRRETFKEHRRDTSSCNVEQSPEEPSLWSNQEVGDKQKNHATSCFQEKEQDTIRKHCCPNSPSGVNTHFDHVEATVQEDGASLGKNQHFERTHVNHDTVVLMDKAEQFSWAPSSCKTSLKGSQYNRTSFNEMGESVSGEPLVSDPQSSGETKTDPGMAASEDNVGAVPEELLFCNAPSMGMPEVSNEKVDHKGKEKTDSVEISLRRTQYNETQIKHGTSCLTEVNESLTSSTSNNQLDPLHCKDGAVTPAGKVDIINQRENLKETDAYKRAMEEEWASRQQQLQIQAEEARLLRKKRKAASMRLLDMERRQKERVEEMRETQKKDEENMNLKEQLRVEIRKELNKLEVRCIDMASLLRGLGIHVGGGLHPLSHEVHAAYKRALLKFHPDRASRTDIRLQVEAEEKFKLISRMKGKFLSTSCY